MPNIHSVILAGFGGLLPTTAQLAASFAAQPEQPLPHWHILFAIALFFGIGAVLSIAFNKESDLGKAVVIGISAPAIITNIINGATSGGGKPPQPVPPKVTGEASPSTKLSWPTFVTSTFAQSAQPGGAATDAASGKKSIVLSINYAGQGRPENGAVAITAVGKDGSKTSLGVFNLSQFIVVPVPANAERLVMKAGDSLSKELTLWPGGEGPPSFAINVRLLGKTSGPGDVLWALGSDRKAFAADAEITKIPLSGYVAPSGKDTGATTCSDEKTLTSLPGDRTAQIAFSNDSDAVRDIYWLNYSGQRVFYLALKPGQRYVQPTYITHPWVITDSGGACKALIVTQQPSIDFKIRD